MPRRCVFYSFHFIPDNWRAATVRSIGSIEGNRPATDNEWQTIEAGGDASIQRWIAAQMNGRSCTVVLVGAGTANRKWINYEIIKYWNDRMGVVGIHIYGLMNSKELGTKGANPFDYIKHGASGKQLSSIVKCYEPAGYSSKERYDWICKHLSNAVEEAIEIRAGMTG
ncbi:MAG: hypothetical protein GEU82_13135 [Luteitalea sp.]|nr:hypothetical protein [Luteitalea sp.]